MKENLSNDSVVHPIHVSIQKKITLLSNMGFIWKEIAALSDIPKRIIKEFAKGNIPTVANAPIKEGDCKWVEKEIDEVIKRLRNCAEEMGYENCPETNSKRKESKGRNVDIHDISLYAIKENGDIIIKLQGVKFYD